MKRSELFFTALLVPIDLLTLSLAFVLAYSLRGSLPPYAVNVQLVEYMKVVWWILPLWLLFFVSVGLYDPKTTRTLSTEFKKVLIGVTAGTTAILALGYIFPNPYISIRLPDPIFPARLIPIFGWFFAIIFVFFGRVIIYKIQKFLFRYNIGVHHAVIIGDGEMVEKIQNEIRESPELGYKIARVVKSSMWQAGLAEKSYHKDEVIVADPNLLPQETFEIYEYCMDNSLDFKYVPTIFGLATASSYFQTIGSVPIVEVLKTPLEGWGRIYKRTFDIILTLLGLIVLVPLVAVIVLMIKITSPGPILFRHKRIGKGGKFFYVFKFRTMVLDAEEVLKRELAKNPELNKEWQQSFKLKNDPRITPLGRFLRKTSLDEIPQLYNVLKGEMSLVGPRPVVEEELEKYGQSRGSLLALKPGLTGLWQVSGRSDLPYDERVKLDIYYVEKWTPLLDMIILIKTALRLMKGAY